MKKHWIEYCEQWPREPMTFWVHVRVTSVDDTVCFHPPAPRPVPGRGWPLFLVDLDGFTFRFASLAELEVCIQTLSSKVLPTTRRLSAQRGANVGPNSHWLSRLPKGTKSWRYRQKAIRYLADARESFLMEITPS
ncbi:MAG: hypothetical protein V4710_03485 [Verrucomicrobiota bacterium]